VSAIAQTLGVARSTLTARQVSAPCLAKPKGRPPKPEAVLVAEIKAVIADMPTYGYRRVHAVLRRKAKDQGTPVPNHKRVYRVMKAHGLLLARHTGAREERRHDGRVAVDRRNIRWCSDGFEIGCDNTERVRVAFSLDCCDREAMSWVATTGGIEGEHIRDLMVETLERRFGSVNRLAEPIEWLSDNGSPYIAGDTTSFAKDIGLVPKTTPVRSPQSNGMAEAFVKTFKRDYANVNPKPDAATVMAQLARWFEHYNEIHPHKALGYRSPREFIRAKLTDENCPAE
jgi:putative transposase